MSDSEFQSIHDKGITSLLEILNRYSGAGRSEVTLGAGDDAAAIRLKGADQLLLTSSEIILEGVHFDLTYTPLHHLGFKTMTAGVSDILAMNGEPLTASIDIAVPNKISVEMVEQLYSGLDAAAKEYGVHITGGELSASHQILVISIHVTGTVGRDQITHRQGARPGDVVCVTGDLGAAMAGLRILLREKQAWKEGGMGPFQPELDAFQYVLQRQLMPKARTGFLKALGDSGVRPTSMIDVTKGLVNELQLLCGKERIGCEIFSPAVPIALETRTVADEMKEDVDRYAFYGGEDFELLFTLTENEVELVMSEYEDFTVIGTIQPPEKGIVIQTGEGSSLNPGQLQ